MRDIQPWLLHCDMLSATQEARSHPDISCSSQRRNAPQPIADQGPGELPEEFVVQVPKELRSQPKLSAAPQSPWLWSAESCPVRATP